MAAPFLPKVQMYYSYMYSKGRLYDREPASALFPYSPTGLEIGRVLLPRPSIEAEAKGALAGGPAHASSASSFAASAIGASP
eukprot:6213320-Pleurochrysis_carterae.AAC.1